MSALGPRVEPTRSRVAEALRLLDRGAAVGWTDLGGSWTTNLRVDLAETGPVVLRFHRRGFTAERVQAMQCARIALADAGLPAVRPLATTDGATWIDVDGSIVSSSDTSPGPAR